MATYLGGKAEISIQTALAGTGVTIPPAFIQEISVEVKEGERDVQSLAGNFSTPNGNVDKPMVTVTMVLDSMERLKAVFGDLYNAPTGTQTTGNFIIGGSTCASRDGGWLNIHYVCDETDDNDVYFYNALAQVNFAPTYNADDALTVEVVFMGQPDEDGNIVRIGTGLLSAPSLFDAATGTTIANA